MKISGQKNISKIREAAIAKLNKFAEEACAGNYPHKYMADIYARKLAQARAVVNNPNASAPLIIAEAQARSMTPQDFALMVIDKARQLEESLAKIEAIRISYIGIIRKQLCELTINALAETAAQAMADNAGG